MDPVSDRASQRVRGFDGLRALALIAVFLQHYTVFGRVNSTGGYGVWLFFALSGFLIVRILAEERRRVEVGGTTTGAALRRFFWRRTLRIMPIYYLVLALFTVMAALHWVHDFTWPAVAWHYAYLSNIYFADVAGRWVGRFGHFWSLAIEEQFYLLAAPALLLTPSRWARKLCLVMLAAAAVCDLWLRSENASDMVLYANSLTNFGALAFGGWMGLGLPAAPAAGTRSWPIALLIAIGVGLVLGFPHIGLFTPGVALLVAALPFWSTVLVAGLLLVAVHRNQASAAVRVLEWGPISYFGKVSYGFYLYHNLIPHWLIGGLAHKAGLNWRVPVEVETLFSFVLALGIAAASWKLIERPLLRFKDRLPDLANLAAALRARFRGLEPAPAAGEP
jgi:peptidoglycan/LPS O-acetylase OafA/YrhL